jgi:hypothetical protein
VGPRGHFSTDADYCSDCGTPMTRAAPEPSTVASVPGGSDGCPDCGTPQPAGARFCEVCRYDFQERKSFSGLAQAPAPVEASATVAAAPPPAAVPSPPQAQSAAARLRLRIVVDPTVGRDFEETETPPQNAPERIFHLDLDENTVGRQYEGRGVHPEIVVRDPGISRRHLKFIRGADNGYSVLELGSANGTQRNGATLEAGIVIAIGAGDDITLGMWTRIFVEAR